MPTKPGQAGSLTETRRLEAEFFEPPPPLDRTWLRGIDAESWAALRLYKEAMGDDNVKEPSQ